MKKIIKAYQHELKIQDNQIAKEKQIAEQEMKQTQSRALQLLQKKDKQINNLENVAKLITPNVQSVGILAEPEKFKKLTALYAEMGIQRFTNIGAMTHFESPWDGYNLGHHLVRWASRPQQSTLLNWLA